MARRLADEAAIAVERARSLQQQEQRLAAEEETARLLKRLEQSLLPRPQLGTPQLRVEYHYVAGEEKMRIGGDFLGAVETPSGELALVIGDVSGHGPDSAALGATLRASWRAMAMAGLEPAEVMARLEQVLERDRPDDAEFATVCCAWLDSSGSRLRVVLGGHHRPCSSSDGAREIDIPYGAALGMFPGERWQPAEVELPDDWALLFYTDGLVEGRAEAGSSERLGLRRLVGLLEKNGSADDIDQASLVRLVDEVRLANGAPLADDVAVLFVAPRVTGGGPRVTYVRGCGMARRPQGPHECLGGDLPAGHQGAPLDRQPIGAERCLDHDHTATDEIGQRPRKQRSHLAAAAARSCRAPAAASRRPRRRRRRTPRFLARGQEPLQIAIRHRSDRRPGRKSASKSVAESEHHGGGDEAERREQAEHGRPAGRASRAQPHHAALDPDRRLSRRWPRADRRARAS